MLNNFKETILKALIHKGWSLEECDYRINEREGFTAEFIAGSSENIEEDTRRRICSLLEITDLGQDEYESFIESLMSELYNFTRFGNLHWNRTNGRVAVEGADTARGIKRVVIKEDAKGPHEGVGATTSVVEAGPTYKVRTRNGLDVFISVSESILLVDDESRNLLLNVYVADKHGYLLDYVEGGRVTPQSTSKGGVPIAFLISLLKTMYKSIMKYFGDELYEYPF